MPRRSLEIFNRKLVKEKQKMTALQKQDMYRLKYKIKHLKKAHQIYKQFK